MKLTDLYVDKKAVEEGIWQCYPGTDFEVKIASTESPAYKEFVHREMTDALFKRREALLDTDENGVEEQMSDTNRKIIVEGICFHLIKAWRSRRKGDKILGDDGKALKCTPENALRYFTAPEAESILDWIYGRAKRISDYRRKSIAAKAGN